MMNSQSVMPASRGAMPPIDPRFAFGAYARQTEEPERIEVPIEELAFSQLLSPVEIARVRHLRSEIQLPEAVRADPGFAAREKKETRSDLWVLFPCMAPTLEPFVLFPWIAA